MTEPSTALVPTEVGFLELPERITIDPLEIARLSFLAGFTGKTHDGYEYDLKCFFDWCAEKGLPPLEAKRGHIELYLRHMETETAWKSATRCKRYDTVRGFYRAADRDEALPGKDPCTWVIRPKIDRKAQRRTFLSTLEFGRFLAAAEEMGPRHHALAALCGINALRIAEACSLDVSSLSYRRGHEVITFVGKGGDTYTEPLSMPVSRAVHAAIDGRLEGPILTTAWRTRMTNSSARRMVIAIANNAGVNTHISPHSLRRTYATTANGMGVSMRDIQRTLRHASPNTTGIYIQDEDNLDRNSTHRVASFMSGMTN